MRSLALATVLILSAAPAAAQAPLDDLPPITDVAPVVVSGVQPGPGMWRVSKGDHVLWVLGTLSPLPKKMQWRSKEVEDVLAQAEEVIDPPMLSADFDTGFFGKLALLPSLIGLRDNPDDRSLQQVLPAPVYARWAPLKKRYIGRDGSVEHWRPMFAAMELFERALDASGLVQGGVVGPVVSAAVKAHGIRRSTPRLEFKVKQPRAVIKEFKAGSLDDVACFDSTLRRVENDLPNMTLRANAWAVGDVDALRAMPYEQNVLSCLQSALQSDVFRKQGMADAEPRLERAWLDAAQSALDRNRVSFATLPMGTVLQADGYLAKLAARGYTVEAP